MHTAQPCTQSHTSSRHGLRRAIHGDSIPPASTVWFKVHAKPLQRIAFIFVLSRLHRRRDEEGHPEPVRIYEVPANDSATAPALSSRDNNDGTRAQLSKLYSHHRHNPRAFVGIVAQAYQLNTQMSDSAFQKPRSFCAASVLFSRNATQHQLWLH